MGLFVFKMDSKFLINADQVILANLRVLLILLNSAQQVLIVFYIQLQTILTQLFLSISDQTYALQLLIAFKVYILL